MKNLKKMISCVAHVFYTALPSYCSLGAVQCAFVHKYAGRLHGMSTQGLAISLPVFARCIVK